MAGDVGEVKCFLDGGVAAADDGDRLVAVEEAIAGCTGRDALAGEGFFRRQAEVHGRGAGGDDQRVAGVGAGVADQREGLGGELGGMDMVEENFGFKAAGMGFEAGHQFRTLHAVGVGRPVVDFGRRHELASLGHASDQQGLEIGPGGIDGGGVAGRAGTENDQGAVTGGLGHDDPLQVANRKIIASSESLIFSEFPCDLGKRFIIVA